MSADDPHFMNLPTRWSVLKRAAGEDAAPADRQRAWNELLEYYLPAVRAYLFGATHDSERTDELVQAFSLNFLQGGFRQAQQEKGPFRHYLKRSLSNLVRQDGTRRRRMEALPESPEEPASDSPDERFRAEFVNLMFNRAWASLEREQAATGTPYHDVLKLATDRPDHSSEELAKILSTERAETYSADRIRKILSRARHKFATHLYEQVVQELDDPTPDEIAGELAELNLLPYCGSLLRARSSSDATGRSDTETCPTP